MADQNGSAKTLSREFPNWPTTPQRPQYPTVRFLFGGLLDFFYQPTKECSIAVNPGDGRHRIVLAITNNGSVVYPQGDLPSNIRDITFAIENKQPAVDFLKIGSGDFNRDTGDVHDFRWMLDLDGEDFYKEGYEKISIFKTKFTLSHGTVFTGLITNATFNQVSVLLGTTGMTVKYLGHMPSLIAAEVAIGQNEYGVLRIDGDEVVRIPGSIASTHEISFGNVCVDSNEPCQWSPGNVLESRRNDFRFHRNVLNLPLLRARYGLTLLEPNAVPGPNKIGAFPWVPWGTDRAPCMGVGWGNGE
jgi:hypothetical protein